MAQAAAGREARTLRILIKADQGGPAEALADALDQLVHDRGQGRGRPPRRRRDHGERHPARQGVGRDHHRLPRAPGQQRARGRRARRRRHQAVPHHLRGGGRRARRRSKACSAPRSARSSSAKPRCARCSRCALGVIAGCTVRSGVINRTGRVRVVRDGVEVYDGTHRVAPPLQGRRQGGPRRLRVRHRRSRTSTTSRSATSSSAIARSRSRARSKATAATSLRRPTWPPTIAAPTASPKRSARKSRPSRRRREGSAHRRLRHRDGASRSRATSATRRCS